MTYISHIYNVSNYIMCTIYIYIYIMPILLYILYFKNNTQVMHTIYITYIICPSDIGCENYIIYIDCTIYIVRIYYNIHYTVCVVYICDMHTVYVVHNMHSMLTLHNIQHIHINHNTRHVLNINNTCIRHIHLMKYTQI